jgi:hypothetical protein
MVTIERTQRRLRYGDGDVGRWIALLASASTLLVGCDQSQNVEAEAQRMQPKSLAAVATSGALNATDGVGSTLGVYSAFWPVRDDQALAAHVSNVASLFRKAPLKLLQATGLRDAPPVAAFDDPSIEVTYKSQVDVLLVEDRSRIDRDYQANDIGEAAARGLVRGVFKSLVSKGTLRAEDYDLADLGTSHHMRDIYTGPTTPSVKSVVQYRFRIHRKLNGIEVANNGVIVGITPQGELSSLRVGGVQFNSSGAAASEAPAGTGGILVRRVATDTISKRFDREAGVPGMQKHIAWAKKMYVMPSNQRTALLAPMLVYRFASLVVVDDGGRTIPTPGMLAYSLMDESANPADLLAE